MATDPEINARTMGATTEGVQGEGATLAPPYASPQARQRAFVTDEDDVLGFVAVLVDHQDAGLFISDVYPTRDEARDAGTGLIDALLGVAAIVLVEGSQKTKPSA